MKKNNLILIVLFSIFMVACNAPEQNQYTEEPVKKTESIINTDENVSYAEFEFEEEEFDFGEIKDGEVVSHIFKFKNIGEAELIINDAHASCGCTVPSWPKEPIAVGEEGTIEVKFNSKNRIGKNKKTIILLANTKDQRTKISFTATVVK